MSLSCTGPQSDYRKLNDSLVKQLLVRDLFAPDPLRIGAYTAEGGYICNREGEVISGLYTLGSTQKGRLYESVAVPELRGRLPISPHTSSPRPLRDFCGLGAFAKNWTLISDHD